MANAVLHSHLRNPGSFVERRVDWLRDISSQSMDWTVHLQLSIPTEVGANQQQAVVVSLGYFPKKRLPDLVAHDAAGRAIPLLKRVERAALLGSHLLHDLVVRAQLCADDERALAQLAGRLVRQSPREAEKTFKEYCEKLQTLGLDVLG